VESTARTVRSGGGWWALQGPRCGAVLCARRRGPDHLAVAGRWLLPCLSFILAGHPAGPSSLPATRPLAARPCGRLGEPALVGFAPLPNGGHRCFPAPSAPIGSRRSPLLGFAGPGSMAEAMSAEPVPLHRRHLQQARCPRCCHRFGREPPGSHRAPTSLFRTASPASPARDSQACCILLPILGFDAFLLRSGGAGPTNPTIAGRMRCRTHGNPEVSRIAFHTPRRTPPPRSRGASPRSLPPRTSLRCRSATCPSFPVARKRVLDRIDSVLSLEALLREEVRTAVHLLRVHGSLSSLGLVPLRGRLRPALAGRRARMAPCAIVAPQLRTVAACVRPLPPWWRRRAPCRAPSLRVRGPGRTREADPEARRERQFPERPASAGADATKAGRDPVAAPCRHGRFGIAEGRSDPPSQADRRPFPPRAVFFRRPSVAPAARRGPEVRALREGVTPGRVLSDSAG
jgi:hypothetical protein